MKIAFITLLMVAPIVVFGQQLNRSIRPEAAPAPVINIKDSEVFTASNGMTVILSENHKLPKVSFDLVMGASPQLEKEKTGLSEIAGSLLLSGTANRSKDELDNEIDYIGARLSADHNSIRVSCLTKHMDKAVGILSDVLLNASFPQEEVDRIIKQNESGLIATKSDPGSMAQNAESRVNFPNHPFGEVMTEETLAAIDRESIVEYYKNTFRPKGSYLVIVGDINKEQANEMVQKYFSKWNGGSDEKIDWKSKNTLDGNRVVFVKKPGAVQSVISVSFPMDINPGHPDYLKLKVLNGILGGGAFGNRLMQNLREDKAYTYGCRSSINVTEDGSWMSAGGNFRNEVTDSAIAEILYELNRITTDLVEDDEINLTKSSMAGAFARSLESPSTIARFALSTIRNGLPQDYYQTYLQNLESITKEDVLEVAQKYFTGKNCNIVVVGNEEVVDKLVRFDADGIIEKWDAFGNEVKDLIPADISKEELIENYLAAVTLTNSEKARSKKMKKLKSMEEVTELSMPQIPFPMKSTRFWMSPNIEGQKMEGQGMVFQKSFFDGSQGASVNMQTGKTEMTAEEIAAKQKSVGLFPEMNYATSGMEYELLGIENKNGKDCYVLKTFDGSTESYDYFDKETFYKVASTSIVKAEGETQETNMTFSNFGEQDGYIFPSEMTLAVGEVIFSGKVISRSLNAKIDVDSYK